MSIKSFLIGSPLETAQERQERLSRVAGLAIFSSDALSSVAYGTEEILLALVVGGAALLDCLVPITVSIVILIAIVATSYRQTINAYPSGGGAYIVAKENLGEYPGLVAGAALLIDYVLTVTVSIAAGVAAISSAFPVARHHSVALCLLAVLFIVMVNLRGVREAGRAFSIPVYVFIVGIFFLIGAGFIKSFSFPQAQYQQVGNTASSVISIFIILKAFASGCSTLTGVEAISNGVRAFRAPEAKNASGTLLWMAFILGTMTLGIAYTASYYGILPSADETVLSQLAKRIFSVGPVYYTIQISTAVILLLAANTSFADFPRLSSIMAGDRYLPRQLSNRGDKLVFSNGIIILALLSMLLLVLFGGDTHSLIPLYAVGVFTAFTLSQAGMVKRWVKGKDAGWIKGAFINCVGSIVTSVVLVIIIVEKFFQGAWIVLMAVPLVVLFTRAIHRHYLSVSEQLSLDEHSLGEKQEQAPHHLAIIPISGVQLATINAIRYARAISADVVAVHVSFAPTEIDSLRSEWQRYGDGVPLVVVNSPYRSVWGPLLSYIEEMQQKYRGGIITVVIPEFIPSRWWHHLLHNQTAMFLKGVLLFKKGVVMVSVPFHLER